jgi:hypothetical protein
MRFATQGIRLAVLHNLKQKLALYASGRFTMSEQSESNGAGWGNRTPVQRLETFYISRYTNPALLRHYT